MLKKTVIFYKKNLKYQMIKGNIKNKSDYSNVNKLTFEFKINFLTFIFVNWIDEKKSY
jgi:hypothetical protein